MRINNIKVIRAFFWLIVPIVLFVVLIISIKIYSSDYIYNDLEGLPKGYRIGVVFGAKLKVDGSPGEFLQDRLDAALDLYFNDKIDLIVLSGERLNQNFNEIDAMEEYILSNDVPIEHTYLDTGGLDTYSTIYRVKNIFQFNRVIYITQGYHLERAILIGKLIGTDCIGYNADLSKYKNLSNHKIREVFANIKAIFDSSKKRKAKVLVDSKDTIR